MVIGLILTKEWLVVLTADFSASLKIRKLLPAEAQKFFTVLLITITICPQKTFAEIHEESSY